MSSIEKAMQRKKVAKKDEPKTTTVQAAVEQTAQAENVARPAKEEADNSQTKNEVSASAQKLSAEEVKQQRELSRQNPNETAAPEVQKSHLGAGISADEFAATAAASSDGATPKRSPSNVPVLNINLERLEEKGFVTLLDKRSLINEEFRSIKRKLLNNAFGAISKTLKHSNLILVSSSKPNEGKTFTAVNLALSIALEQDKTVLLVDSDVLKPSVAKTLDIGKNVGLIEYLLGEEKEVGNIMYRTNIDNLRVIPAGLPHHLSNELLASDKMMKLIDEFASRYPDRIVVFDAPPLLGVNETALMAEQCGQGVVVVEEHKSKVADVTKAVSLLPDEMAVGFVLNKVISSNENQGYGYYYGSSDDEKVETGSQSA